MKEEEFKYLEIRQIGHNPWQPRKRFEERAMEELIASVREKGVLQPILVRPVPSRTEGKLDFPSTGRKVSYLLVAGERRFRAAAAVAEENGGLQGATIPAMVRDLTDDEAFDIAMIENLQREDLNELEEAESFQAYLERHKETPGAAESLAERIGVSSRYVYRRVRLLGLPSVVLEAWGKGGIPYGYLEQLMRLEDEKEILEIFRTVLGGGWRFQNIKQLKAYIDDQAPKLKDAKFDWMKDCIACGQNSDVQKRMFGEETKGARCLNPKCFKQKQNNWLIKNWKKTGYYKQYGTNGFRFAEDVGPDRFNWYNGKAPKKCRECDKYVTLINLAGKTDSYPADPFVCIGEKSCFEAGKKKGADKTSLSVAPGDKPDAPRVSWHGQYFREAFFREQLLLRLAEVPADDERALRVALFALVDEAQGLRGWFNEKHKLREVIVDDPRVDDDPELDAEDEFCQLYTSPETRWSYIETMPRAELLEDLKEGAARLLIEDASPGVRRAAGAHLGIDLEKEWRITQEYLDKKTVKEIHEIAGEFGLWERKEAKAFLFEQLLKKRGNFKSCKKPELCRIILESGMDLAGVVPKEVRALEG